MVAELQTHSTLIIEIMTMTKEHRIAILSDAEKIGLTVEVIRTEDKPARNQFHIYMDGLYIDRFDSYREALKHLSVSVLMTALWCKSKEVIWWPNSAR